MEESEKQVSVSRVPLNDGLGAAVIVNGEIVAWFADFNEENRDWCTENHFGEWLVWRASAPELVPLTEEEHTEIARRASEIAKKLREFPEAPN